MQGRQKKIASSPLADICALNLSTLRSSEILDRSRIRANRKRSYAVFDGVGRAGCVRMRRLKLRRDADCLTRPVFGSRAATGRQVGVVTRLIERIDHADAAIRSVEVALPCVGASC